jgi:hypothetical protein
MRMGRWPALMLVLSAACGARTGLAEGERQDGAGGMTPVDGGGEGGNAPIDGGGGRAPIDGGGGSSACVRCYLTSAFTDCGGLGVEIAPYTTGGVFGGFQSVPGTGAQSTTTVLINGSTDGFGVTVLDPDYPENHITALDGQGNVLDDETVEGDGIAGSFTSSEIAVAASGIARVELRPDPADYIAYDEAWICMR